MKLFRSLEIRFLTTKKDDIIRLSACSGKRCHLYQIYLTLATTVIISTLTKELSYCDVISYELPKTKMQKVF
ncbi:MAG: hypothetical protein OQK64_10955 [Ignavibacteriaceae bacterium]|nr:hypothetical protein [Ignavibacteriaceae bacterium]